MASQRTLLAYLTGVIVVALLVIVATASARPVDANGPVKKASNDDIRLTIKRIYQVLQKEQVQRSKRFRPFPLQWQEDKGLYRSYIHLNFVGNVAADLLRNGFAIPDSNMFVTSFVVSAILEAHGLGTIQADEKSLQMAVEAIGGFQDKNKPAGIPACVFWPQTLMNGTWSATPVNLVNPLKYFSSATKFVDFLVNALHLDFLADKIDLIVGFIDTANGAFRIPADLDDSSVNLAMGGMLLRSSSEFPSSYAYWEKVNANISALYDLETKYSYKTYDSPRSDYTDLLDPRVYYFLEPFLNDGNQKISLGVTWLSNVIEDKKTAPYVSMPFHTNNVDLSVSANFLYGTAHAALQGLNGGGAREAFLANKEIQDLYTNTAKVVAWGVSSASANVRPDLALLYYPSIYDFLWMAARTARFLDSHNDTAEIPTLSQARDVLLNALFDAGTAQIISAAQHSAEGTFWDDFLGNYGGVERGEDRLFSTALAINTLLDIWTTGSAINSSSQPRSACQLQWRKETPRSVKQTVDSGIAFLAANILSGKLKLENAFFSGSMKSQSTNPFSYPATYSTFLNGTELSPERPTFIPMAEGTKLVYAMRGVTNTTEYQKLVQKKWFGYSVPSHFNGFNEGGLGPWPYWSSPAMTYAMSILALSNYVTVEECN